MENIYGLTQQNLEKYFVDNGEKKFKAIQVYEWLYKKRINSFSEMRNVSKTTIENLSKVFSIKKLFSSSRCASFLEFSNHSVCFFLGSVFFDNFACFCKVLSFYKT